MSNKLIFFEGPDGVGKSSLIDDIEISVLCGSIDYIATNREPTEAVADLDLPSVTDPVEAALWFAADRRAHMRYMASLLNHNHIICDRGPLSSIVYQGMVGGVDLNWLSDLNDVAMADTRADATIIFYAPFETICQRIEDRDDAPLSEQERDHLKAVWLAYGKMRLLPHWQTRRPWTGPLYFIDTDRPFKDVLAATIETVKRIIEGEAS